MFLKCRNLPLPESLFETQRQLDDGQALQFLFSAVCCVSFTAQPINTREYC